MCWMPKEIGFACFVFLQFLISRNKSSLRGPCFASKLADLEFIEMMKKKNFAKKIVDEKRRRCRYAKSKKLWSCFIGLQENVKIHLAKIAHRRISQSPRRTT